MLISNWYKARRYLHFDRPVGEKTATDYVSNPDKVRAHSFYPFIRNTALTVKTKHDDHLSKFESVKKERHISYAAHMDSHIYAYYSSVLNEAYEKKLLAYDLGASVLAFRSLDGKSNIHHARAAFEEIKSRKDCSVLCFDIEKFFDKLDHKLVKKAWKSVLGLSELPADHYAVFKAITKHSWVDREQAFKALNVSVHNPAVHDSRLCEAADFRNLIRGDKLVATNPDAFGIPQGSPISAIISNFYMLEFDRAMISFLSASQSVYYRYCDDIMIICPINLEANAKDFVEAEIKKLLLDIQHKKTDIQQFTRDYRGKLSAKKAIQYLGFMFDGERTFIRPASLTRYYRKMKVKVRLAKKSRDRINVLRRKRGESDRDLFLKSIYNGYTHLGRRNFITYGYRAAKIMESKTIRQQLRSHWRKIQAEIQA
ncbi:reverse transcriptase/maturase family protein [Pseudomonas sp. B21-009]|uniref:antiviral reverse transcriptase Drt2 n=1 Tax=Pseudomonas sp. B21-009 TaxID=2895470 RepID=UPI0021609EB0|nr:antiviral reverse transcriptase Drt2 [Pseudomonas sp. B21-009]UVM69407.1 reverse transcriptase/maturase family protein [Pseudomonas sp. B21-009]